MSTEHPPRLVARFAVSSLVAFVAIGSMLAVVISRQVRTEEENAAKFHATFVATSILADQLARIDLRSPADTSSSDFTSLVKDIKDHALLGPVVRLKVWRPDGTIVFSDDPRLVGKRFEVDEDLVEAFSGRVVGAVTDLRDAENVEERSLATKLFSTYVPVVVEPATDVSGRGTEDDPRGSTQPPLRVVVELYQTYDQIQRQVSSVFRTLVVTLLVGLSVLYVLLLPISRRMSRTLRQQTERLEQQASRLKDALWNEQRSLRAEQQTVAKLRELNRVKDQFVAVASHELRTPLTSIIGYAKTLRRPEFADDVRAREEFLEAIERQGDRLFRLVQNLLATANIEGEQTRLTLAPMSIADMFRDLLAGLGAKAARIELLLGDIPQLVSDRQRVELVVANLLDNAIKFSPEGEKVELGARLEDDSVRIWVRDRGIGIPEDQIDSIFDRFYQVDSSATRRFGGVGLGLSLVKDLVTSLGGTIKVISQKGYGSSFSVTLPLVHPNAEPVARAQQDEVDRAAAAPEAADPDAATLQPAMSGRSGR